MWRYDASGMRGGEGHAISDDGVVAIASGRGRRAGNGCTEANAARGVERAWDDAEEWAHWVGADAMTARVARGHSLGTSGAGVGEFCEPGGAEEGVATVGAQEKKTRRTREASATPFDKDGDVCVDAVSLGRMSLFQN